MRLRYVHLKLISTLALLSPFLLGGLASAQANWQSVDFGQASVNTGSPATQAVTFSGLSGNPTVSLHYGVDFGISTSSCSAPACSVTVTFNPKLAGLQHDAVLVTDGANGPLLATAVLHGVGLGAQVAFNPGLVSFRQTSTVSRSFQGVAVDRTGTVYFGVNRPYGGATVEKLSPGSSTSTVVAGRLDDAGSTTPGVSATQFRLYRVGGLAFDGAGNLFVIANGILKVEAQSGIVRQVVQGGSPLAIAADTDGNLFYVDGDSAKIWKIAAGTGSASVIAGNGDHTYSGDGGLATNAGFAQPNSIAVDNSGNVFVGEFYNRVRRIDASSGRITTLAGDGTRGSGGDGGPATSAQISVAALGVDGAGNLYIGADLGDFRVREVETTTGLIHTAAGNNFGVGIADGLLANQVQLPSGYGVAVDAKGNLFLTELNSPLVEVVRENGYAIFPWQGSSGSSINQTTTVLNIGNQLLNLSSLSTNGAYQAQTAATSPCAFPGTVTPGSSCDLAFSYAAQQSAQPGSAVLVDDALNQAGSQQTITLQTFYPQAVLSVSNVSFGSGVVGNFGGNSWFNISNVSTLVPLQISSFTLTGANPNDFRVDTTLCNALIAQRSTCQVDLFFYPTGPGPRSATLNINDNAASSPQTVLLTGTATTPGSISFSPATLDFGTQNVGSPSVARTVTVTNSGGSPIDIQPYRFLVTGDYYVPEDTCFSSSPQGRLQAGQSCTVDIVFIPRTSGTRTGLLDIGNPNGQTPADFTASITGVGAAVPLAFVPIAPCRVADTRLSGGQLAQQNTRDFPIQGGTCGVPATAVAYSLNVTAVPSGPLGWLTIWPSGQYKPISSTLNSSDGRIKANAAIVPAGNNGDVSVFVSNPSQVILDVNGYFVPASTPSSLAFYPLTPCRVVDTRNSSAPLGGPFLAGGQSRDLPLPMSSCGLPANAQAYSLNFTAVPRSHLSFLTVWPTGQARPVVSTLNAPTGAVTANAAVVPAGQAGDVSVFATDDTDLIVDVNGYYAAPAAGGLSYYTQVPCRVLDTRSGTGTQPFNGQRTVPFAGSCSLPSNAKAFVTNATVVPSGPLSFLTLWPDSGNRPNASTLNAYDGTVTSNMAIVPSQAGSLNVFATDPTHLILDIEGYFAPAQ